MSHQLALSAISDMNLRPVMLSPQGVNQITSVIRMLGTADQEREQNLSVARREDLLSSFGFSSNDETERSRKPFAFAAGLAIIPVHGMLINRFGQSWGWATGYNFIRAQKDAAEADPDVVGIIYDMNSYGGMVTGCFETAEEIFQGEKPSMAVVDSACYSACYALASGADKIVVTPSSGAGSVGVITMHMSMEKMLEDYGLEITLIYSGDHKADGNPYEKLPDSVKADVKKSVDATREKFITLVATNRSMEPEAIRNTQAQSYDAEEALALGLIDDIAMPSKAVSAFLTELSGSTTNEETAMSTETTQPGAQATTTDDAQTATANARRDERARVSAITGSEAAKANPTLANHLAFNTDMSAVEAEGILAAAKPAESAAAPATTTVATVAKPNAFAAAMNSSAQPEVGADTTTQAADSQEQNPGSKLLANIQSFRGKAV